MFHDSVELAIDELDRGTYNKVRWFTKLGRWINRGVRKIVGISISASYVSQMEDFDMIERGMRNTQLKLETYFE
jgi:hypothetical protein